MHFAITYFGKEISMNALDELKTFDYNRPENLEPDLLKSRRENYSLNAEKIIVASTWFIGALTVAGAMGLKQAVVSVAFVLVGIVSIMSCIAMVIFNRK